MSETIIISDPSGVYNISLPGTKLRISKDSVHVGNQPTLNLIQGDGVTLTVTNNTATAAVDVTIDSEAGSDGGRW